MHSTGRNYSWKLRPQDGTVEATLVEQGVKIAGNVLAKVQAGSISDTVNGSSWQGSIRGAWYDLGDNADLYSYSHSLITPVVI